MLKLHVVHGERFLSRKNNKEYTKLFVKIGYDLFPVISEGDLTPLAGCADVPFRLVVRNDQLRLYYAGEEE